MTPGLRTTRVGNQGGGEAGAVEDTHRQERHMENPNRRFSDDDLVRRLHGPAIDYTRGLRRRLSELSVCLEVLAWRPAVDLMELAGSIEKCEKEFAKLL
jgi:hypothetical protein